MIKNNKELTIKTFYSNTLYNPYQLYQELNYKNPVSYSSFVKTLEIALSSLSWEKQIIELDQLMKFKHIFIKQKAINKFNVFGNGKDKEKEEEEATAPKILKGGESHGLLLLDNLQKESQINYILNFSKPKTSPNSLQPSTTTISTYLTFGNISIKRFYNILIDIYANNQQKGYTKPPTSLLGQIYWKNFIIIMLLIL